jgi:hypothetical protein
VLGVATGTESVEVGVPNATLGAVAADEEKGVETVPPTGLVLSGAVWPSASAALTSKLDNIGKPPRGEALLSLVLTLLNFRPFLLRTCPYLPEISL